MPDRPAIWNEFGFDDYDSVRKNQAAFIQFMSNFHKAAVKYAAQLAAVNYGAPLVAEIDTLRSALNDANNAQEVFQMESLSITETRVIKHNAVWDFATQVCELGKVIFRTSPAKYQQYTLPASEEPAGSFVLSGTITDNMGEPLEGIQTNLLPHGLQSISDSNGMYGYGSAPAGPATLSITSPLYPEQNIPVVIDPDNPQVIDVQLDGGAPPPPPMP